jgi:DNA-3-methyladenine glycosylase
MHTTPMNAFTDILPASFYDRDPVIVARELLGQFLVREFDGRVLAGRIVETEAYLATADPASHAYSGRTIRNAAMFGPPGCAYVYLSYGLHHCVNVVTESEGVASAVLLRAVEPLVGLDIMQTRRGIEAPTRLARGPGSLCHALAIDRQLDTWDLTLGQRLWCVRPTSSLQVEIAVTPRVGISVGRALLLRFYVAASPFVSRGPRVQA